MGSQAFGQTPGPNAPEGQSYFLSVSQFQSVGGYSMKKQLLLTLVVAFGFPLILTLVPVCQAAQLEKRNDQEDDRHEHGKHFVTPAVFQAAGPTANSIQSTVDAFRAALGDPNNGNSRAARKRVAARSTGTAAVTTILPLAPVTPFNVFLNTRGAQFTTPGKRPFPGASIGRTARRPCSPFQQSDLRHHLQHLQPVAVVHSSGQQHH